MKLRIAPLLTVFLISLLALPAFAATFDANGQWRIETDPGQKIFGQDVPAVWLLANIEQFDNDTFTMSTEPIVTLNNAVFSGSGYILGDEYTFDPIMVQDIDTGQVFPDSGINLDLELSLAGFTLTNDNMLIGEFSIDGLTDKLAFTGTKEAVPVPAAVWLLGSGMVALFGIKRRTKC